MAYEPQVWADGEAGGTPITAATLTHIEEGIESAAQVADAARPGDWTPDVGDIPNLPASKVTSGTFADARIPALAIAKVTGLQAALDGKQASGSYAAATHTHTIANVSGLQAALDGKQASGSYATQAALDALITRVEALEAGIE